MISPTRHQSPPKSVVTPRKHHKDHIQKITTLEELEKGMKEKKVFSHSEWYYDSSLTDESVVESVNSLSGDRLSLLINPNNHSPSDLHHNTTTSGARGPPISLISTSSQHSTKFSWDSDASSVSLFSPSEKKELETQFLSMEGTWHSEWVNNMNAEHSFTNIKEYNTLNAIPEDCDLDEKQEMEE